MRIDFANMDSETGNKEELFSRHGFVLIFEVWWSLVFEKCIGTAEIDKQDLFDSMRFGHVHTIYGNNKTLLLLHLFLQKVQL